MRILILILLASYGVAGAAEDQKTLKELHQQDADCLGEQRDLIGKIYRLKSRNNRSDELDKQLAEACERLQEVKHKRRDINVEKLALRCPLTAKGLQLLYVGKIEEAKKQFEQARASSNDQEKDGGLHGLGTIRYQKFCKVK